MITESQVLKLIRGRRYGPMTLDEIAERLEVPPDELPAFKKLVEDLELSGEIVEVKNRCLADPDRVDLVVGTLLCNPRGFGFIRPMRERDGEDMYVEGENMSSALHGDIVAVRIPSRRRDRERGRGRRAAGREEVKVVSIVRRARTEIVGTMRVDGKAHYVIPDDPRLFRDVFVDVHDVGEAKHDDKVAVRITVWPTRHMNPVGVVEEVFGPRGELEAERLSVARAFGLRLEFPAEVALAAKRAPSSVSHEEMQDRQDLTGDFAITVDPVDARDFDDAVGLERIAEGRWLLRVHIADVSHYVPPDGEVDMEARRRGTSVYLPGQVLPMLPEALSNEICSLKPDVVRLVKTVEMTFNADGTPGKTRVYNACIRSRRRMTYEEVQEIFDGEKPGKANEELSRRLHQMRKLSDLLRERRREAGMLELDIPEPHILTDSQGRTVGVVARTSDASHRMIEDFMLAANEAVAHYLIQHNLPYICRAHDEPKPEAIHEYRQTARALGHAFPSPGTRAQIQKFLERVAKTPEATILSYLFLRSMKIARYEAADKPHYALAARHYLHFTSPIRRYPDLLVHRILDEHWSGRLRDEKRREYWRNNLPVWAGHSTETEQSAESAERAINTRRLLEFVSSRKEAMSALVTGVGNFGLRVQLTEYMLDGVVRMSTLADGYYRLNAERHTLTGPRGKQYRLGQMIAVRVLRYDEFKHQIEFEPVKTDRGR